VSDCQRRVVLKMKKIKNKMIKSYKEGAQIYNLKDY